jgi:hypothetical protein
VDKGSLGRAAGVCGGVSDLLLITLTGSVIIVKGQFVNGTGHIALN